MVVVELVDVDTIVVAIAVEAVDCVNGGEGIPSFVNSELLVVVLTAGEMVVELSLLEVTDIFFWVQVCVSRKSSSRFCVLFNELRLLGWLRGDFSLPDNDDFVGFTRITLAFRFTDLSGTLVAVHCCGNL